MKLPEHTHNGITYTVDERLQQFRACEGGWENGGMITFVDYDSELGQQILTTMYD